MSLHSFILYLFNLQTANSLITSNTFLHILFTRHLRETKSATMQRSTLIYFALTFRTVWDGFASLSLKELFFSNSRIL